MKINIYNNKVRGELTGDDTARLSHRSVSSSRPSLFVHFDYWQVLSVFSDRFESQITKPVWVS